MEGKNEKFWNRARTLLLLKERLEKEEDFKSGAKSRKSAWSEIRKIILDVDESFPFTAEEMVKKFQNMFTAYKKIKKKNQQSEEESTRWEHFTAFDEVYGNKHFIKPPESALCDTMEEEIFLVDSENLSGTPMRKKRKTDVLEYLQEMNNMEQQRHEEYMSMEKEKLQIEKEKLELLKSLCFPDIL